MQKGTAGAGGGCVWWSWGSVLCLIETSKHVLGLPLRGIMHHASQLPVGESFDSPSSLVRHHSVSDHASDILRRPRHLKGDLTPLERADILRNGCERRSRNRRNLRWFQPDAESRTGIGGGPNTKQAHPWQMARPLGRRMPVGDTTASYSRLSGKGERSVNGIPKGCPISEGPPLSTRPLL
jgi:hypothetical protein